MKKDKVTFTVKGKHKVELTGDAEAVQLILNAFVRGACEMHMDEQSVLGRSREEVAKVILERIRIADRHYKLGESDGYKCDLSDA